MSDPRTVQSGETVRFYILANRYIDVRHDGWTIEASSPRGVGVRQEARDRLSVITLDETDEDEL